MPHTARRHFLGWDGPAIPRAAAWIVERAGREELDLPGTLIVAPGSHAARELAAEIGRQLITHDLRLLHPEVVSPRVLATRVIPPRGRSASPTDQGFVMSAVIEAAGEEVTQALWPAEEAPAWSKKQRRAQVIATLIRTLAFSGRRASDVAGLLRESGPDEETERWEAMAELQQRYEHALGKARLAIPELTALDAIAEGAPHAPSMVLVGIPELLPLARSLIRGATGTVDALVFADHEDADRFDALGVPMVDAWFQHPPAVADEDIRSVSDMTEQAEAVLEFLAADENPLDPTRIRIGLADVGSVPALRFALRRAAGVSLELPFGAPASETAPGQFVSLLLAHARDGGAQSFSDLVRHPVIEAGIARAQEGSAEVVPCIEFFDTARARHLIEEVDDLPQGISAQASGAIGQLTTSMRTILGESWDERAHPRPLEKWIAWVGAVLRRAYEGVECDLTQQGSRRTAGGLRTIREVLEEWRSAQGRSPQRATLVETLELLTERLAEREIPPESGTLRAAGWLDLTTDAAPVTLLVGMNDDVVPGNAGGDPFLPDSLRERLGMPCDRTRLARDAFILHTLARSRRVVLWVPRVGADGEPKRPSRLLMSLRGRALAERVRLLSRPHKPNVRVQSRTARADADGFYKALVVGDDYEPPRSVRVTDFDAYLRSPAGWYLERRRSLREFEIPSELSPSLFGSLAHAALEAYGRRDAGLEDPRMIEAALCDHLSDAAARSYGVNPSAAVQVQTQVLRYRFRALAERQAERMAEGWRIVHTEWTPADGAASLLVDGELLGLRGRIDRIDRHPELGWALIDYKTGTAVKEAVSAHVSTRGRWKSLQLPLYRHLVQSLGISGDVMLGYASVSPDSNAAVWSVTRWETETLSAADEEAARIVREWRTLVPGAPLEPGQNPPDEGALGALTGLAYPAAGSA